METYELIIMSTGESIIFNLDAEGFIPSEVWDKVFGEKPATGPVTIAYLENSINKSKLPDWYSGLYVRKVTN